jgi:hypothetical protein
LAVSALGGSTTGGAETWIDDESACKESCALAGTEMKNTIAVKSTWTKAHWPRGIVRFAPLTNAKLM